MEALKEELASANRKVDRYVHLGIYFNIHGTSAVDIEPYRTVASLYEELDTLRRSICYQCKKKFVPSAPASLDPGHLSLGIQIGDGPSSNPPPLPTTNAGVSGSTSIPIPSVTAQHNQTNSTIVAPHESSSSVIPNPPSTLADEIEAEEPSWSVSHNPDIKPALHIDLVKTFNFTADVFCVKFSPDGKYLAVGLDEESGRTYIYDVEKGLKIWLAPSSHKGRFSADFQN
jgi:hypothetical protein